MSDRATRERITYAIDHSSSSAYREGMCRNIRVLFNFEPPATAEEIRAAATQYVRKVSGARKPAKANEAAFEQAIEEVAVATTRLIESLVTTQPTRNREEEARKGRERWKKRAARARET